MWVKPLQISRQSFCGRVSAAEFLRQSFCGGVSAAEFLRQNFCNRRKPLQISRTGTNRSRSPQPAQNAPDLPNRQKALGPRLLSII